jgi:hypothetical protein
MEILVGVDGCAVLQARSVRRQQPGEQRVFDIAT